MLNLFFNERMRSNAGIALTVFVALTFSALSAQSPIVADFSDGTWGEAVDERPASGDFPSFETKGFNVRNGVLNTGGIECEQGGRHTARIALDKSSTRSYVTLPEMENVGELIIHASTGSAEKSFVVQEKMGRQWENMAVFGTLKERDSVYILPVYKAKTQLRIANNTGSTLFLWQIKTTVATPESISERERQRPLVTNFTDGSWGRPTSRKPASGDFPSSEAGGFVLHQAYLASGQTACAANEAHRHSGRIVLDKDKTGAYFEFPEVEFIGEVEIHAATGSDDRSFLLQEKVGKRWKTIATFSTGKKERVYTFPAYKARATLRITNNTGSSLSIYQVKIHRADAERIAHQETISGLETDFSDGTWGEIFTEKPKSGDYPTFEANDFWVYSGILSTGSSTCPLGGKHQNRIILDKASEMARIDFPELNNVEEVEIHAATGSDNMSFEVQMKVGRRWQSLGIFPAGKKEQVYTIPIHQETARLRIKNSTSSALMIYQIIVRNAHATAD